MVMVSAEKLLSRSPSGASTASRSTRSLTDSRSTLQDVDAKMKRAVMRVGLQHSIRASALSEMTVALHEAGFLTRETLVNLKEDVGLSLGLPHNMIAALREYTAGPPRWTKMGLLPPTVPKLQLEEELRPPLDTIGTYTFEETGDTMTFSPRMGGWPSPLRDYEARPRVASPHSPRNRSPSPRQIRAEGEHCARQQLAREELQRELNSVRISAQRREASPDAFKWSSSHHRSGHVAKVSATNRGIAGFENFQYAKEMIHMGITTPRGEPASGGNAHPWQNASPLARQWSARGASPAPIVSARRVRIISAADEEPPPAERVSSARRGAAAGAALFRAPVAVETAAERKGAPDAFHVSTPESDVRIVSAADEETPRDRAVHVPVAVKPAAERKGVPDAGDISTPEADELSGSSELISSPDPSTPESLHRIVAKEAPVLLSQAPPIASSILGTPRLFAPAPAALQVARMSSAPWSSSTVPQPSPARYSLGGYALSLAGLPQGRSILQARETPPATAAPTGALLAPRPR